MKNPVTIALMIAACADNNLDEFETPIVESAKVSPSSDFDEIATYGSKLSLA